MRPPERYLQLLLGDLRHVAIAGKEYDLYEEVSIPADEELEQVLHEHPVKLAGWKRLESRARALAAEQLDRLEELKSEKFVAYWNGLEEREREELNEQGRDEDAPRDEFNRKIRGKSRLAEGRVVSLGRWRRNFSDDYCWGHVRTDEAVIEARRHYRDLKEQAETAGAVVEALEHRSRCISHLCAFHRDATK